MLCGFLVTEQTVFLSRSSRMKERKKRIWLGNCCYSTYNVRDNKNYLRSRTFHNIDCNYKHLQIAKEMTKVWEMNSRRGCEWFSPPVGVPCTLLGAVQRQVHGFPRRIDVFSFISFCYSSSSWREVVVPGGSLSATIVQYLIIHSRIIILLSLTIILVFLWQCGKN